MHGCIDREMHLPAPIALTPGARAPREMSFHAAVPWHTSNVLVHFTLLTLQAPASPPGRRAE
eukprot:3273145-Prymnesium_polylepis.1